MYRMYREIQNLDQNFSLIFLKLLQNFFLSISSRMIPVITWTTTLRKFLCMYVYVLWLECKQSTQKFMELVDFSPYLNKGDNFCDFCLRPCTPRSFRKVVYSKRKQFVSFLSRRVYSKPMGTDSFLLEKTPFQKASKIILLELPPLKEYQFPLN